MPVDRSRPQGLRLTGEYGLSQQLTKRVLESALEGKITDYIANPRRGDEDPKVKSQVENMIRPRSCTSSSAIRRLCC